jgi:hypothetical protein
VFKGMFWCQFKGRGRSEMGLLEGPSYGGGVPKYLPTQLLKSHSSDRSIRKGAYILEEPR